MRESTSGTFRPAANIPDGAAWCCAECGLVIAGAPVASRPLSLCPSCTWSVEDYDDRIALVAHDLRTPLTAITLLAGRIAKSELRDELRALNDRIVRAAHQMMRIVADLFDATAARRHTLEVNTSQQDVLVVVARAVELMRPIAEQKEIRIVTDLPTQCSVAIDAERIVQVLGNLIGNAIKFTPNEGCIEIRVTKIDGHVEFVVQDSGPGFTDDAAGRVFEPFVRDHSSARGGGLGLGLFIVREIIEAHGGKIAVEARRDGGGAAVRFTLPADPISEKTRLVSAMG